MSEVNVAGVISIIVFYLLILSTGLYAAWRKKQNSQKAITTDEKTTEVILAGRNISLFVGCCTMTATWVGGGYINGTAESVYTSGLSWAQAPWGYAVSLTIGGLFFAKPMREANYMTMLDPLQERYGKKMGALLYIPAFLGETFYTGSILAALGATLAVILGLNMTVSVIISAFIAVGYTLFGGLYAVAFTDVIQLACITVGLWLAVPFALTHDKVNSIVDTGSDWLGTIEPNSAGLWTDYSILIICGGIPWQVYYQRVLSSKTPRQAQLLSFIASFGCFMSALPPVLIGAAAKSLDWTNITNADANLVDANGTIIDTRMVLPMVLQYLTPGWVSFIGLGAISAAVMSSADSSVLSASSMFGHNIYKTIFKPNASGKEVIWVIRIGIFVVGALSTLIGLTVKSIYALFILCSDLVFVVVFPQLIGALHIPFVNTYGSICAYVIGLFLRITGGESLIGIPATIKYPFYQTDGDFQNFPFRSMSMVVAFLVLLAVSYLTNYLFDSGILSKKYDYFNTIERRTAKNGANSHDIPMQAKFTQKETLHSYDNNGVHHD